VEKQLRAGHLEAINWLIIQSLWLRWATILGESQVSDILVKVKYGWHVSQYNRVNR
jgi:hypothetical protein